MQFACLCVDDWPSKIFITSLCIAGDFNGRCNGETALIIEPFPGSVSPGRDLDYRVDLSTIITANETHNRSGRWDNIVCWRAAGGKLNRALLCVLVSGYSIALSLWGSAPPSAITHSLSFLHDKFALASSVIKLYTQKKFNTTVHVLYPKTSGSPEPLPSLSYDFVL